MDGLPFHGIPRKRGLKNKPEQGLTYSCWPLLWPYIFQQDVVKVSNIQAGPYKGIKYTSVVRDRAPGTKQRGAEGAK